MRIFQLRVSFHKSVISSCGWQLSIEPLPELLEQLGICAEIATTLAGAALETLKIFKIQLDNELLSLRAWLVIIRPGEIAPTGSSEAAARSGGPDIQVKRKL